MLIWIIIIGVFLIIGLYVLKLEHSTRKLKVIIVVVVGFLLLFSIATVFRSDQVDLSSPSGIISAIYLYVGWMGKTILKLWDIGVDTTGTVGNAIKLNFSG
ncbi:MAG: hypothetical protein ABIF88_03535 [archaeon]